MTQSGQGDEPSARPAHEGIVLPSDGGEPLLPGMTGTPAVPPGGQSWGGSWGPGHDQQQPQHQQHQQGQGWPPAAAQEWQTPEQPAGPGPMPPEGPTYDAQGYGGAQPYHQQHQGYGNDGYPQQAAPLPPMDEAATQFMPPVGPGQGPEGATQYLPPVPSGGADQAATQYIPPVASGALPPEATGDDGRQGYPQQPVDEAATQYIPPYQAGADGADRQPPAEFDNLFRGTQYGADAAQGSTQQMPRVPAPDPRPPAPMVSAQPAYRPPMDHHDDGGRRGGGRTGSRVPLIAAVGVGIVVLGIGAGALLSGGGDDGDDNRPVASSTPASEKPSPSASAADPAQPQAAELDKLLADSGSSRSTVIQSVERIKQCQNLDQAAADLRGAAKQRADLVSRLGKLSVDKLPNNAELNAALTAAWQASAAADNHYAVWARQAKSKKVCVKGHARSTNHTQAGNAQSGTASAQKAKAAQLWNAIATKYGLTTRQPTQL
ncbi:hypothetical protein [Streptomyces sp. NBC_01171]|uniref:hypothetical protein n=1 Tax=Streptomyces sp. NBC_01171 TaxID=2903757 RepID=UPI0038694EB7|nr:hypothetical protein OG448_17495 [Streptomyces sp. NBC_01171]